MEKTRYKFVVLEGMDGVGKTTYAENIKKHSKEPVTLLRFPSPAGYRDTLLTPDLDRAIVEPLFVVDFLEQQEVITKVLQTSHVICDRYIPSYLVHFHFNRIKQQAWQLSSDRVPNPKAQKFLETYLKFFEVFQKLRKPDLVIFLKRPPDYEEYLKKKEDHEHYSFLAYSYLLSLWKKMVDEAMEYEDGTMEGSFFLYQFSEYCDEFFPAEALHSWLLLQKYMDSPRNEQEICDQYSF